MPISFDHKNDRRETNLEEKLQVIESHISSIEDDLESLSDAIDNRGDVRARSLTMDALFKINGHKFFSEGSGAPTTPGIVKFSEYHDIIGDKFYKWNGSSWIIIN